MPLYEYECDVCNHRFERQQRFSDPPVANCPECNGSLHKVFHPASVIFKGSGWYVNDNRTDNGKKEKNGSPTKPKEAPAKDNAESKAAGTAKSDSGGDSKSSSTKKE